MIEASNLPIVKMKNTQNHCSLEEAQVVDKIGSRPRKKKKKRIINVLDSYL